MKRFIFTFFLVLSAVELFSQQYIVEFDRRELKSVPSFLSIDKISGNKVRAYIWSDANFQKFKSMVSNFTFYRRAYAGQTIIMATTEDQMKNWDRYPTYDLYVQMMEDYAKKFPNIARLDTIGQTEEGRLLLAMEISDNPDKDEFEPQFFYTSTMHGDETTGYIMMLRLIDYLLNNYGKDSLVTYILNNYRIFINPLANPDGTYHGGNSTIEDAIRYYSSGVDPNRDFLPVPGNSGSPKAIETKEMMQFAYEHNFIMSANFHGGSEVYNYPWDVYTSSHPHADDQWFQTIGKAFVDTAREQNPSYMTDVTASGVTEGGDWYVVVGSRQDYMNYVHHCKEVTVELSETKLLSSDQLPVFWNILRKPLLQYILNAERGLQGIILDSAGRPLHAHITLVGYDKDSSSIYTDSVTGAYFRPLLPGNYQVNISASGLDTTISINVGQGRTFLNIVPKKSARVIVRVYDTSDNPIADVPVKIISDSSAAVYTTDLNGQFECSLNYGVYEFVVNAGKSNSFVAYQAVETAQDTFVYHMPDYEQLTADIRPQSNNFAVYPNPAHSSVHVVLSEPGLVNLVDLTGKVINKRSVQQRTTFDLSRLPQGIYLLRVKYRSGYVTKKIVHY